MSSPILAFRPTALEAAMMRRLSQSYAAAYGTIFTTRSEVLRLALRAAHRLNEDGKLFELAPSAIGNTP